MMKLRAICADQVATQAKQQQIYGMERAVATGRWDDSQLVRAQIAMARASQNAMTECNAKCLMRYAAANDNRVAPEFA